MFGVSDITFDGECIGANLATRVLLVPGGRQGRVG